MRRNIPYWYGERLDTIPLRRRIGSAEMEDDLARLGEAGVDVRPHTACWGAFDGRIVGLFNHMAETTELVQAERLIIATGAGDVGLAFPGWTLPGVIGGVAALDRIDAAGSLGGRRVVVLGAGALGRRCAAAARAAGHEVVAIVDPAPGRDDDPASAELRALAGDVIQGATIREARGRHTVDQVHLMPVAEGAAAPGRAWDVRADTLVVAITAAPNIELPYLLGCRLACDVTAGGWSPVVNGDGESTVAGVYVVGDAAGFGRDRADSEQLARTAVRAAAASLRGSAGRSSRPARCGIAAPSNDDAHLTVWHALAAREGRDDLVVCRCEGTTLRAMLDGAAVSGEPIADDVKRLSRAGAGACQGRCCRHTVTGMLAERYGLNFASMPAPSIRPPVRPIPLGALANFEPIDIPLRRPFAELLVRLEADHAAGLLGSIAWQTILYRVREENAYAQREALDDEEAWAAARALEASLRVIRRH
jgi:thioredoxin reductase